jgi:ATP-dependent Clp protease ATP-binding subunit ClpA
MTSNIQEEALKEFFRPEFLNRIDDVIIFHSLSEENLLEITDILLKGITKNLEEKEIQLSFDDSLKKHLIKVGYDKEF